MPDKKYLIEIPDMPDGSGVWDADKWERNKDAFMADYPDAQVFELGEYDEADSRESDQILLSFDDEASSGIWDQAKWERNKYAFTKDNPEAQVSRVRYVDYWGQKADANRAERASLMQPDEARNARLAELGYYDDLSKGQKIFDVNSPSMIGLKPLSSAIDANSVSGHTTYLDPRVQEFFANDSAYTDKMAEIARLDAEYDENPAVIAQREWEAQMLAEQKAYADNLEKEIKGNLESDVDMRKAARGGTAKRGYDPLESQQMSYLLDQIAGEEAGSGEYENEKLERYTTSLKFLEKAKIARDLAGKGFGGAVIDWGKEGLMDAGTQDDVEAYNEIGNILTRLEKEVGNLKEENLTEDVFDKYLSKDEQALIKSFFEYNKAMADAQQDMSRAYKGGKIFAESIPFMLEFLATGGIYKGAGRAATKGLERALVKWVSKAARNTASRTARKIAAATARDLTYALVGTTARTLASPGTYERMAEASVEIEDGHLNRAKNAAIAAADMYVENLSEISGGLIGKTLGWAGKGVGKLIAKTPLSKVGGMLADNKLMQSISAFMPKLEALGFHGLPEEIGEEFIGNAIREVLNIQPGALKEMVSDDNFGAMLIGFAPMTLIGAAGGAISLGAINYEAAKLGNKMREMMSDHYSAEEMDAMMSAVEGAATAEEIQQAIKPMAIAVANAVENGMITQEQAAEEIEMLYQWGGFMAQNNALLFSKKAQENELANAKRAEMADRYGRFWQEDETESVQVATLNNGSTVFVTSAPAEDGKIATIDVQTGKKGFANISDIASTEVEGEQIQSSNKMTMAAFLNGQIAMGRKTAEETRMTNERNAQIDALRAEITPGTRINLGTEGSPEYVFAKKTSNNGVIIVDETGMESTLGWEQAADALGKPIIVETDQQKLDAEVSARLQRLAERRMQRNISPAVENATTEAAEESAEVVAQEQKHIPLNEDGTVNEAAFWTQDPEGYVKWNDEQNNDGGQDSLRQIAISKQELIGMLNEVAAGQNTSNPTMRKAAEKQVAAIAEKIARLEALEMSYADALAEEKEAVKQTAATPIPQNIESEPQTEEEKVKAEEQRRQPLRERAKELSKKLGVKVNIAEDISDVKEAMAREEILRAEISGGKQTVAGWFNPTTGEVTIYLPHAKDTTDVEQTFVHEVVAHKGIRGLLGEEGFNVLCDSVWDMMTETERVKYMAYPGVNGDKRAAADEYIAHYAETMNLEESKPIWDRIMDLIMRILDSMGVNLEMTKDQLSDIIVASYQKLVKEAEANAESEMAPEEAQTTPIVSEEQLNAPNSGEAQQITAADGEVLADTDGKGGMRFSIRTWEEGGRDYLAAWLANDTTLTEEEKADILARMDEFYENAQKYTDTYVPFGVWSEAAVKYDSEGNPLMSVIKANGDYAMNLDFSLVCKKRRPLNKLLRTLINRNAFGTYSLKEREIAEINWILQEHGFEVACALCFVDAKRYRVTGVADVFAALYNKMVKALAPKGAAVAHFNYSNNPNVEVVENGIDTLSDDQLNWKAFDKYAKKFKETSVEGKVAKFLRENPSQRRLVDATDFIEAKGFEAVKEANPALLSLYNSKKGTGGPKASFGDVQYLNDILKKDKAFNVEKAYAVGGVRIQSFSDFVPHMYFDYMQLFAELAAKKLPAHAYTKEVLFAKIFGLTGLKINLSLVPAVVEGGVAPGLDAEGNYAWADAVRDPEGNIIQQAQSFPYDEAMAIQSAPGYARNCGAIAVGISDEHIEKMLDDPNIPFIIPYHKSSLNAIVARMTNIDQYKDYTNVQNTRKGNGTKLDKGTKDFNFNEYLHGLGEAGTPQMAAQAYLDWCKENNFKPKFSQFAYHPNYYKLLVDFNTVNVTTGEYTPQGAVTMSFPTEQDAFGNVETLIQQGLQEDAELEEKMDTEIEGVADEVEARLAEIAKEPALSEKQQMKRMAELADERTAKIKARSEGVIDLVEEAKKAVAKEDAKGDVSFRITPEQDKDYMAAVERGDMETAQRMVLEAAKLAMPNTKVVDEDGYPKVVYHGSTAMFTVFDKSRIGSATGTADGRGFYFTTDRDYALGYKTSGGQLFEVFLNIEKPLSYDKKTITKAQLRKILKEADRVEYEQEGEHYMLSNYANYNNVGIDAAVNEAANLEYDYADNDVELVGSLIGGSGSFDLIMDAVKKVTGKSGMIAPKDNGTIHYVVTDPTGIKTAEPVTYDNDGNVIRLSERFNPENEDIRFRMRTEEEDAMEFTQQAINDCTSRYNEVAEVQVFPENEETAKRFGYTMEELKEIGGTYVKEEDIIVIFASKDRNDSLTIENIFFHESIHKLVEFYPEFKKIGEWMWNNADVVGLQKIRNHIENGYDSEWYSEEMLTYGIAGAMSLGVADRLESALPEELQGDYRAILNEIGYEPEKESRRTESRVSESTRRGTHGVERKTDESGRSKKEEARTGELTAEERRVIGEYFPEFNKSEDARMKVNSQGKDLTEGQKEFFANSKAVDKDGNLLVLYHGTPRAGFTEFKSGWFTTSKEDAISYSGDRKGRLFDPNEKYEPKTLVAGDFPLGYMTFDSEEDRAAFLEIFPYADEVMSEREYEDARMGAEDEEYDALTARRKEFAEVWNAYREYERERFVDTTVGDLIANPEAYTEEDLMRAMLEYDSNASLDSLDDISAEERKDALVSALQTANEETEGGILDMAIPTRVPRNGEGIKHNDLGNRTYEVYANVENPYEIDANGRGSEFESGDIYKAVEKALADEQYDGVIIRNWRVGRNQQLGDVVVPKNGSQIKLTSNENPTRSHNVSFRFIGEKGAAALDKAEEATVRLDNLAVARQLEDAGKDARAIKLATGWERGADDLWRYETADFSLKPTWINATTLEEAIKDDELFKAYPELRKTKVRLVHNSTDVGGEFSKVNNSIVAIGYSVESMQDTLVHEVQHAIQEQEGFEGGGNPMIANAAVAMEWMNKYGAIYDNSSLKKANNAYSDTLDIIGMMDDLRQLRTDKKNTEKIKDTISTILVRLEKLQNYLPAPELKKEFTQKDLWPSRIWDTYAWLDNYQGYIIGLEESESITDEERKAARIKELMRDSSGGDAYHAITGEVEARNATKRRAMSYIERRQSLASETEDVAREDHVFIKGALEELAKVMEKMQKGNVSFRTSLELDEEFGDAWRNQQNEDGRHSTQVANTKSTYEKIGRYLEDAGMKGASILDASSGLGLGTQALREMGFQVDDVEPFPSENREAPTFSSYADIDKQYDVVISNAVLNVIPDDWRTDVLHQMADAVKEGGKMIINTRPASNIAQQGVEGKTRITLDSPSEILVKRGDRIAAYQKGFTSEELAEWIKSELGEGWRVEKATKKNSGISGEGTAVVIKEGDNVSFRVTGIPTDEVVANGLTLTPAQTAEVAANIFAALPEESRKKITEGLNGNILGLKDAILQIPASLATKENWDEEDIKLANAVRTAMQDAIDKQQATSRPLTTKEALWMLYDSTNTVKNLVDAASRAFVAHNLGFDPLSVQRKQEVNDYVRFRTASNSAIDAATDMYNYETSLWTERLKESWLDMNQSVISLQKAMAEASGMSIEPWENLEFALNRLSSKSYADKKKYLRDFLIPMWDTILDIVKHDHVSIEDIERYMMLKHGLERNKKFASRDAKEFYRAMYDLVAERMKNQSHAEQVVALSEAKKKLADIDAQIAVASSSQLPRLNEARARAQYDVDVADLVLRGDETQNEAELQVYYNAIDNEADPKYREFREKDYGGLTSMFVDSTDVKRSDYKSEEAYQQAVLASTTPRYDDVAAMESAAEREVSLFENKVYMYRALWDKVNAATKETLRHQYESGMITREQYEAVRDMFEFYVPLRGFADNTTEDMYSYYMTNSAGGFTKPILAAKGRKTRAESPLGWIGTMAESAIQADNKNEAKMCLYYATLRRPDQNLLAITETWYEYTGQKDANGKKIFKAVYPPAVSQALSADDLRQHMDTWEADMKQKQSRGEAYKGSQRVDLKGSVVFQDVKEEKEHIVRVKVAGKDYSILINGNPRAAQAINGLLNPDANVGPVAQWIGDVRRSLSALLTSYSPLFWVANYQRDLLSSIMRVSEADGWNAAMKYLANRRKAWRVASYIYKYDAGTLGDSYYEKLYKEFADNGGVTGYTALTTNKEYENLLEKYANNVDKHLLNAVKGIWDKFMGFGEAIEQVSRFAAFITAREEGKSIEEAINAAKEVSVNFNRKGSAKPVSLDELDKLRTKDGKKLNKAQRVAALILSAMPGPMKFCYYFVNASIQALSSSVKLAKKSPGKATTWVGMYMGTSIALAMLNYLLSDDDDDEYLNLPDYLRHSTALVKVADGYYFKWSIPQEMRPFYAWADILVRKMMGKMPHKSGKGVGKEMALAVSQWLPVNPFEAEDPLLSLVPDFASPLAEIKANTNAFGGKIYDDMAFKSEGVVKEIPAYRKATEKTGDIYVDISEFLNDVSGGDEVTKGKININPAIMEHLIEGYGGGIYDFAKMMVSIPSMILSDDPVQIKEIPFVNKVILSVDETNMYSHTNEAFFHYKDIADNAKRVEKEYRESDDPSRADDYQKEEDWRVYLLYKQYEADFKNVKERLDNAVDKEEEDLLKQEQNVLREMFLNDIAKGNLPEVTFQIREDIKRIDKEIKEAMKPVSDANKERLEKKNAGDVDGMLKAIEKRDSLKETPEYRKAEEMKADLKEIKRQLEELGTVTRSSQRDSVIGEIQKNYDALIRKRAEL